MVSTRPVLPDPSTILDIKPSNKGLLIPRVSLIGKSDLTTIPNPENDLLVYNLTNSTGTSNKVIADNFYTFSAAANSWSLLVIDTVLNTAIENLGVLQLQVVANLTASGNDLEANIRKIFFNNKVYNKNNTYDPVASEFKAPKNGYYQIDASILLKSYQAQSTTNIVRLGVSNPYTKRKCYIYLSQSAFKCGNQTSADINPSRFLV